MHPAVRRNAVDVGYRMAQHTRPPYFARPGRFEDAVARGVAFNPDRVEAGARIFDREVETEGAAVVRISEFPTLATEEFLHGVAKAVALGAARGTIGRAFGPETPEQRPAGIGGPVRDRACVFQISLEIVAGTCGRTSMRMHL